MRKLFLLVCAIAVLSSCKSSKTGTSTKKTAKKEIEKFETVGIGEVTPFQKNRAYDLGHRILNTCNTSKFKPFTKEEATEKVIQNTTLEKLSSTCRKYLVKYGKFEDLRLIEIIRNNEENSLIFRFKADYQRKFTQKELQVVLNSENKVASIKSTDWTDVYLP